MEIPKLLARWRADPNIGGNVVHWYKQAAQNAIPAGLPPQIHPALRQALETSGVEQLYAHQRQAWDRLIAGKHIAIATGTASGKSLCYQLPSINRILSLPNSRSLLLFPTKALAQDQLKSLQRLVANFSQYDSWPIHAAVYDGDTPASQRTAIRSQVRLLLSNPDMLHTGILPHHTRWAEFFQNLDFVIIDEMHTYRGVFGSHVANIIRRLKRVANFYGQQPQFILTSATIGNPQELAQSLLELPVELIDSDGSPRGERYFLLYNPPLVNPELGLRASMLQESVRLAEELLAFEGQSIIFGRTRRTVEVMLRYLRSAQVSSEPPAGQPVQAYRSGYLPQRRRAIESGLRSGDIRTVIATSALELGIDIGGLNAAILAGYPGSVAATWQRVGRAGRSLEASLAIVVAASHPLDQYIARHPEYFFEQTPEQALINPDNDLILFKHLQCAAFELPFRSGESYGQLDAALVTEYLELLTEMGRLHHSGEKYFWMAEDYPAANISLRSASANKIIIQDHSLEPPRALGEVDWESASWLLHPEAIYLQEAETYLVENLDLQAGLARVYPIETDYYTRPRREIDLQQTNTIAHTNAPGCQKAHGEITVTTQVTGYQKVRWETHENLGFGDLSLPPNQLLTTAYWLVLNEETVAILRDQGLWSNDPNQYGPHWPFQRNLARARDGYHCQACYRPEPEDNQFHVHHKVPFRAFTSAVEANQLSNLVTLCPACHRKAENVVRIRSGLSGLSYCLANLAPIFLMCDPGDLGQYAEAQSPLGAGQPVVAIYEMIPAGIGFSPRLYQLHNQLLAEALDLVSACQCSHGCPSCVGPGGEAGSGGKAETLALLQQLCQTEMP